MIIKDDETAEELRVSLVKYYDGINIAQDFRKNLKVFLKSFDELIKFQRDYYKDYNFISDFQDISYRINKGLDLNGLSSRVFVTEKLLVQLMIKEEG